MFILLLRHRPSLAPPLATYFHLTNSITDDRILFHHLQVELYVHHLQGPIDASSMMQNQCMRMLHLSSFVSCFRFIFNTLPLIVFNFWNQQWILCLMVFNFWNRRWLKKTKHIDVRVVYGLVYLRKKIVFVYEFIYLFFFSKIQFTINLTHDLTNFFE